MFALRMFILDSAGLGPCKNMHSQIKLRGSQPHKAGKVVNQGADSPFRSMGGSLAVCILKESKDLLSLVYLYLQRSSAPSGIKVDHRKSTLARGSRGDYTPLPF